MGCVISAAPNPSHLSHLSARRQKKKKAQPLTRARSLTAPRPFHSLSLLHRPARAATLRDAFRAQDPGSLLSISTNFRSCTSILTFVNERFEVALSVVGQPGFTALDPFHDDRGGLCVAALDIAVADENGKAFEVTP